MTRLHGLLLRVVQVPIHTWYVDLLMGPLPEFDALAFVWYKGQILRLWAYLRYYRGIYLP